MCEECDKMKELTDDEMWEATLVLWKKLSKMEDCSVNLRMAMTVSDFKNRILMELGYKIMNHGCPFCEKYYQIKGCPIGNCYNRGDVPCYDTPYKDWEYEAYKNNRHSQEYAKKFYEYLQKLYKKRGVKL